MDDTAFLESEIVIPLLLLNSMSLIRMFSLMAYTVLYYECKELLPKALKSLKRPFVTWFFITLLDLGYFSFLVAFVLPLVLIFNLKLTASSLTIVPCILLILALVVQSYLAVVRNLALVVSILEEKCSMEALGKAGKLIKGPKLIEALAASSLVLFFFLYRTFTKAMPVKAVIIPLLLLNSILCLVTMVSRMAYTFIFYESKASHGEELELHGNLECTKITSSAIPLINEDAV